MITWWTLREGVDFEFRFKSFPLVNGENGLRQMSLLQYLIAWENVWECTAES